MMRRRLRRMIERVQVVRVEPGDTLIASVPRGVTGEDVDHVGEALRGEFPNNHVVVVVGIELWVGRSPKENSDD